jgi:hypothetical protein
LTDAHPTPEPLQQAAELLRQGEFEAASKQLASFLQEHPGSADAWVLFSYALEDPVRKLECVERALQLDPEHAPAAQRMQELRERFPEVQTTWAKPGREPQAEAQAQPEPALPAEPAVAPVQPEAEPQVVTSEGPAQPVPGPQSEPVLVETEQPAVVAPFQPEARAVLDAAQAPQVPPFSVPIPAPAEAQAAADTPPEFLADLEAAASPTESSAEQAEASAAPGPSTAPLERPAADQPGKQPTRQSRLAVVLAAVFGCALVAGAIGLMYSLFNALPAAAIPSPTVPLASVVSGATSAATPVVLPPSWTPTSTPTITPTRTPEPTNTPTPTHTLAPPNATQMASLGIIQQNVEDLRGLGFQGEVSAYMITRLKARTVLEDMYRSAGGSEAELEDEKRELVALGLVKPTYNLIDTVLNSLADAVGGFFDPLTKRLFIIGGGLGAVERFVYSHEFAHALVDQHFPFDRLGAYPVCQRDQDQCRAITGLVEGDATLVMNQWLPYASPQDFLELLNYTPPSQALPEQFPPPFAVKDGEFPYQHGMAFVQFLHGRGNWAEVNRAYANLPVSSEQILHPEKYLAGERPQEVHPPALEASLGEGWRPLANDTLGEWGTYLLLGYSADLDAQLLDGAALYAAQGWGGDRYQVYYHEASQQTLLAALWRWDSDPEAVEFHQALHQHLNSRFRGLTLSRSAGACWHAPDQVSCIYQRGAGVLWILAPDETALDSVLGAYAGFP